MATNLDAFMAVFMEALEAEYLTRPRSFDYKIDDRTRPMLERGMRSAFAGGQYVSGRATQNAMRKLGLHDRKQLFAFLGA